MSRRTNVKKTRSQSARSALVAVVWTGVISAAAESPALAAPPDGDVALTQSGFVSSEFIYEKAPFPSCHASTIVELPGKQLLAAWFGGKDEGEPDVGIWVSRHDGKGWSPPVEVADGVESPDRRYPCWNPVLFRSAAGEVGLFFKVGPRPRRRRGVVRRLSVGGTPR